VLRDLPNAKCPNDQQTDFSHQGDRWREQGPQKIDSVVHRQIVLIGFSEARALAPFLCKGFESRNFSRLVGWKKSVTTQHS
jgi:hypothetical protein